VQGKESLWVNWLGTQVEDQEEEFTYPQPGLRPQVSQLILSLMSYS